MHDSHYSRVNIEELKDIKPSITRWFDTLRLASVVLFISICRARAY